METNTTKIYFNSTRMKEEKPTILEYILDMYYRLNHYVMNLKIVKRRSKAFIGDDW